MKNRHFWAMTAVDGSIWAALQLPHDATGIGELGTAQIDGFNDGFGLITPEEPHGS
jgi:hypothetical protein